MALDPIPTNPAAIDRAARAIGPAPSPTPTTNAHAWHTWTPQELRGIPAVGRGAGAGAITETQPGWNLDHWPDPDWEAA